MQTFLRASLLVATVFTGLAVALVATPAWAQPSAGSATPTGAKTLAISDVKIAKTLSDTVNQAGKSASLGRVAQAMDGQLIDRFQNTRKFKIIARSDLDTILKEQGLTGSGNVDSDDAKAAQSFKIKGVEYLLVTTIDDFQDFNETATFEATGEKATKRVIRLSAVGKLFNSTTGELLESANIQIANKEIAEVRNFSTTDGQLSDTLLLKTSRDMADKMAQRVVDVVYPARIIGITGTQVTINRGDGTGIAVGQTWIIHSLGDEMKDPDTGESLGREEVQVGKVKITSVQPKTAKGEIIEGNQIPSGALLRQAQPATAK